MTKQGPTESFPGIAIWTLGGKGLALPSSKMLSWYPTDLKVPAKESWKAIGRIEPNTEREKQVTSREKEILEISLKC